MVISAEEKMMYEVMKALYDSGIPINFKGSMVLKALLIEAGFPEDTRHTVDIDANWYSDESPSTEQMVESIQNAMDKNDVLLKVNIYRMYGAGRSAGFELNDKNTGELLFTMDVDVNRPAVPTKIYEVEGVKFRGVTSSQILADKISVVSTNKVFRRIKDVVDIYYLSQVLELDAKDVLKALDRSGRKLGDFEGFVNRIDDLKHSYEKFRFSGGVNKPLFDEVYQTVRGYISELILLG